MNLRDWLNSVDSTERERVAGAAGTSVGYLWQLAGTHRKPSTDLAKAIEAATAGVVARHDLRPDIWEQGAAA
jgi:DNA-binding transcriptional regulator YdaS (Cro superfamily)